jgi:phosphoribosylamine--glycine ligase
MRVLIVGGGGREHALAWRLRQEDPAAELFAAPGNPGIAELATCTSINATDLDAVLGLARHLHRGVCLLSAPDCGSAVFVWRSHG